MVIGLGGIINIDDQDVCYAIAVDSGYIYLAGVSGPTTEFVPSPSPIPPTPPPTIPPSPRGQSNAKEVQYSPSAFSTENKVFIMKFGGDRCIWSKVLPAENMYPPDLVVAHNRLFVSASTSSSEFLLAFTKGGANIWNLAVFCDKEGYNLYQFELTADKRKIYSIGTAYTEASSYVYVDVYARNGRLLYTLKIFKNYGDLGFSIEKVRANRLIISGATNASLLSIFKGKFRDSHMRYHVFYLCRI